MATRVLKYGDQGVCDPHDDAWSHWVCDNFVRRAAASEEGCWECLLWRPSASDGGPGRGEWLGLRASGCGEWGGALRVMDGGPLRVTLAAASDGCEWLGLRLRQVGQAMETDGLRAVASDSSHGEWFSCCPQVGEDT